MPEAVSVVVAIVLGLSIVVGVLVAGFKYLVPGFTAYANYTARFKREVVIGQTPFEAAEVRRSYTTGGKSSTTHVVFHGLFFHLDFNKALKGLTIVQPEGSTPCELGSRGGLNKIELESPTFESKFAVYTSDDVEARYILTPAMMELTADAIRIDRGLRPLARTYSRATYGEVVRLPQAVYIGKTEGVTLINVTASPNLSEAESRWIAWEMQQALNGGSRATS